jgi:FAD/FMN-containing dehydrogenase
VTLVSPAPREYRGIFRTDDPARAVYSEAAGITRLMPAAIAVPNDPADVVTLVRWANEMRVPITPRGSGTSMAGGALGPGVVVDLSALNTMGAIDQERKCIEVGPGVLRDAVNSTAAPFGLRLPVDPSSGAFCTIGGMVATNASGPHSLRFGSIRKWVSALDCVFEDGTRVEIRRGAPPPKKVPALDRFQEGLLPRLRQMTTDDRRWHPAVSKDSSGYALRRYLESGELVDLLVGSEGTLCVIVGIELSLEPMPGATSSVLGAFDDLDAAVEAAAEARAAEASACELLDKTFLRLAAQGYERRERAVPWPVGTEAILLAETEGNDPASAAAGARDLRDVFHRFNATSVNLALTMEAEHELWDLRHAASPTLAANPGLTSMQIIEDGAVPLGRLADYVRGVRSALDRQRFTAAIFGHAGDGHVHVNPLVDVSSPDWRERLRALLDEVVALTSKLEGTLSGEHGDGRLRTSLLRSVWPAEALAAFAMVKSAFDPNGILNPGVKVGAVGWDPLESVKYDPSLPQLPEEARRALDYIARNRAYATPRLSLIGGAG